MFFFFFSCLSILPVFLLFAVRCVQWIPKESLVRLGRSRGIQEEEEEEDEEPIEREIVLSSLVRTENANPAKATGDSRVVSPESPERSPGQPSVHRSASGRGVFGKNMYHNSALSHCGTCLLSVLDRRSPPVSSPPPPPHHHHPMTTAHRPTWKAAVGQASTGGWTAGGATSSAKAVLSLNSHTQLKFRTGTQRVGDRQKALKESLLKLEEAERKAAAPKGVISKRRPVSQILEEEGRLKLLKQTEEVDDVALAKKYDDDDAEGDEDEDSSAGGGDVDNHADGDSDSSKDDLDASSDEEDESSDDEDDEAALQAELAKIRAERDAVKQQQAEEEAKLEEAKLEEAALLGNPLLAGDGLDMTGKFKRKWNDDVVFRNQAKGEPEVKKRFINDTIRNDFHKRFLNKFIR